MNDKEPLKEEEFLSVISQIQQSKVSEYTSSSNSQGIRKRYNAIADYDLVLILATKDTVYLISFVNSRVFQGGFPTFFCSSPYTRRNFHSEQFSLRHVRHASALLKVSILKQLTEFL